MSDTDLLFPTHVGVSLQLLKDQFDKTTLPHTRGGVPTAKT